LLFHILPWVDAAWIISIQSRAFCRAASSVSSPYSPIARRVGFLLPGYRVTRMKVRVPFSDTRTPSPGTCVSIRS
jgi:hypothetical protein